MHIKKIVVESYEMAVRWKEEISLVRQEMSNFIKFYMRLLQEMCAQKAVIEEKRACMSRESDSIKREYRENHVFSLLVSSFV